METAAALQEAGFDVPVGEERLERAIEQIVEQTGQPRVSLVCHSMGGLVARCYIAGSGANRVDRLVTIGSPHGGSVFAFFGVGDVSGVSWGFSSTTSPTVR